MFVQAILSDKKPGPTLFTVYLWFLSWILLAASFGTTVETNGQWHASIVEICNGLFQCAPIQDVPASRDPGVEVYFPCDDMKKSFGDLLPLNIVAFILSFVIFCLQIRSASESTWDGIEGVLITFGSIVVITLTAVEAALVIYLHLGAICVFPGRESEGPISMRHGMFDMELGPTFTLLVIAFIVQVVAVLWTNRRWLRGCCDIFGECGGFKAKLARAKLADEARKRRGTNQPDSDAAAMSMLVGPNNAAGSAADANAAAGGGGRRKQAGKDDRASLASFSEFTAPPPAAMGAAGSGSNSAGANAAAGARAVGSPLPSYMPPPTATMMSYVPPAAVDASSGYPMPAPAYPTFAPPPPPPPTKKFMPPPVYNPLVTSSASPATGGYPYTPSPSSSAAAPKNGGYSAPRQVAELVYYVDDADAAHTDNFNDW